MSHPQAASRFPVDRVIVVVVLAACLVALWMLIHANYRTQVEHDDTKVVIEPATRDRGASSTGAR